MEVRRAHALSLEPFRLVGPSERGAPEVGGAHRLERSAAARQFLVRSVGRLCRCSRLGAIADRDDTFSAGIRQRAEEYGIDGAENCRGGTDPHGERERGDHRENWISAQATECVAHVAEQGVDPVLPAGRPYLLARGGEAADSGCRLSQGVLVMQALALEFTRSALNEMADLEVRLRVGARRGE